MNTLSLGFSEWRDHRGILSVVVKQFHGSSSPCAQGRGSGDVGNSLKCIAGQHNSLAL